MSQTKVQLIAPIGVVTATTLETTGVLTATTFVGDIAGTVTGITSTTDNLNLGIITATSFAGDFTGIGSGLTGTPNVVAGVVTATKFVGNTPGLVSGIADGTNINAGIITATSFVGNITGNAAGLSTTTSHANLGIVTATSFHGSGANLDGVSSGPVAQQAVTANGATTTIDLSNGNLIYMTQSANTTVAFANTEGNTDVVYLVRTKDDNTTERTITWPSGLIWNGGSAPTLVNNAGGNELEGQVFKLTTRDNGATWYGSEVFNLDNMQGYELYAWGYNFYGQIGDNNRTTLSSPIQIPGSWSSLKNDTTYSTFNLGVRNNKTLWAWGSNTYGQLGDNSRTLRSSPTQIPGTTWSGALATWYNAASAATKTDGTLWTWGQNNPGGLGQNNRTNYSSPVQIPGTTWPTDNEKLGGGEMGFGAIKTDGTLWVWGASQSSNWLGQNQGGTVRISSPVQVGSDTNWKTFKGGGAGDIAYALKTDGTLWAWGRGLAGQLGQNQGGPGINYSSPVQIPGTTWDKQSSSSYGCAAIKTDGTLWVWGKNLKGTLAQNNINPGYSSPVQVPGTWSSVAFGEEQIIAGKTDGTLWVWGEAAQGRLGLNSNVDYSSPVQLPGTWVTTHGKLYGGDTNTYAFREE